MKLAAIVACHLAGLKAGTKLTKPSLKELLPDTTSTTIRSAKRICMAAGFATIQNYGTKEASPELTVNGEFNNTDDDIKRIVEASNSEAVQSQGDMCSLRKGYQPLPKSGDPFKRGIYKLSSRDSFEEICDGVQGMPPVVEIRTKANVDHTEGNGSAKAIMICKGKKKLVKVETEPMTSTNLGELRAILEAIQVIRSSSIIRWITTTTIFSLKGKNTKICSEIKEIIDSRQLTMILETTEETGTKYSDYFNI